MALETEDARIDAWATEAQRAEFIRRTQLDALQLLLQVGLLLIAVLVLPPPVRRSVWLMLLKMGNV